MSAENMFQDTSLWVVGNFNRDVKTAPIRAGEHLFSDGETSTSFIGETIGGGGANSAFAAAALGANVTFAGKVGADGLGDRLKRTLQRHSISARLTRDREHSSGTSIALSFDNGHRHFVSCLPANGALAFADLDLKELSTCGHLLRADVWFSESMLFGGNAELFQAARKAGVPVSLDLNWDPQWGHASAGKIRDRKTALRAVLPFVNLAHGNVRELREFTAAPDLDTALKLLADWGVGAVVAHLGAQGAGFYQSGKLTVEPPVPVSRQVHTTGTGDVLSVCMMLLSQRSGVTPAESLRTANAVVAQFMEGRLSLIPLLED
jgi:sugar/nucleoside kinase (ribokinase family)